MCSRDNSSLPAMFFTSILNQGNAVGFGLMGLARAPLVVATTLLLVQRDGDFWSLLALKELRLGLWVSISGVEVVVEVDITSA